MLIIPAIDIKDGKCVRLYQGDYSQVTIFADDPATMGQRWREEGAQFLHIVDLDGAKAGHPVNLEVIERIMQASGLPVEVSGGLRDEATVSQLLDLGVTRVTLGTIAVKDPALTARICQRWGAHIVIGIDARNGLVATDGWQETSTIGATDLAQQMTAGGAVRFSYTDITRDGTLTEPNYAAIAEFIAAAGRPVIAGGGISRAEQLPKLASLGLEGVILGRALYTGDIKLSQIL